jgi:Phage integrase central domain/Arm DNA-binding domain
VPQILKKLSAKGVEKLSKPGHHGDGGGLYLRVSKSGAKSWVFRFKRRGSSHDMGLGSLNTISLADARTKAKKCRKDLDQGEDPIKVRRTEEKARRIAEAGMMTFDECAETYIKDHRAAWRNAKHAAQWESTLLTYASPVFGDLPVGEVDRDLILKVLRPIWHEKTETATRVRGRVEAILDWAAAHDYR